MTDELQSKVGDLVLPDAGLAADLNSEGYAVRPFLDSKEIAALEELFAQHVNVDKLNPRFDTLTEVPLDVRNAIGDGIHRICRRGMDGLFSNYKVAVAMFYGKKSGPETELGLHLDPSMTVDPFHHYGIWIPLIDADARGGELCLLPRSMRFTHRYQALSIPSPYEEVYDLVRPRMTCLAIKAGNAVIFHNNLLHFSRPNVSGRLRLGVVIKIIDANAPLIIAHGQDDLNGLRISLIKVSDDYYRTDAFKKSDKPEGSVIGTIDGHRVFSISEAKTLLSEAGLIGQRP